MKEAELEINRLKIELQNSTEASTSLKKELEESKLKIEKLVEITNNLQAIVDLTGPLTPQSIASLPGNLP